MKTLTKKIISVIMILAVFSIVIPDIPETLFAEDKIEKTSEYIFSISDADGDPGDNVTVDVTFSGSNNLDGFDGILTWDNSELKADEVTGVSDIGLSKVVGSKYIAFSGFSSDEGGLSAGKIFSVDFTIPKSAQPGTVYDLKLSLNALGVIDSDGNQVSILNNTDIRDGKIEVSKGAVTTVVTTSSKSTSTTVTTVTTAAASKNVTKETTAAVSTSVAKVTTITTGTPVTSVSITFAGTAAVSTSTEAKTTASSSSGTYANTTAVSSSSEVQTSVSSVTTSVTAVTTPDITEHVKGDANGDNELNIRDAAFIARKLADRKVSELPDWADYNDDGKINIRDAAAIARYLVNKPKLT